jgi:hypothetical protein
MGHDTKTYWLTDRQSRCNFGFDFEFSLVMGYSPDSNDVRTEAEEPSLLRSVTGKRLVKAEWEGLACDIVICKVWRLAKP